MPVFSRKEFQECVWGWLAGSRAAGCGGGWFGGIMKSAGGVVPRWGMGGWGEGSGGEAQRRTAPEGSRHVEDCRRAAGERD